MTEQEWLNAPDVSELLIYLRGEVTREEKEAVPNHWTVTAHGNLYSGEGKQVDSFRLRRFAQQCCTQWWHLPLDATSRAMVLSYERFLSGEGAWEEYLAAWRDSSSLESSRTSDQPHIVESCEWSLTPDGMASLSQRLASTTAYYENRERIAELEKTATEDDRLHWGFFGHEFPEFWDSVRRVVAPHAGWLREIVGNPFRPRGVFDSRWVTSQGRTIAETADCQQEFASLPILADLLEENGCTDLVLLEHLRGPGPHCRGCWALDALLGREGNHDRQST